MLQQQGWVILTETMWPGMPEIFTVQSPTATVYCPLFYFALFLKYHSCLDKLMLILQNSNQHHFCKTWVGSNMCIFSLFSVLSLYYSSFFIVRCLFNDCLPDWILSSIRAILRCVLFNTVPGFCMNILNNYSMTDYLILNIFFSFC